MQMMWQRSDLLGEGAGGDLQSMAAAMERYEEEVQRHVPAERLLVWSVTDGWEPLCEFLDVPVPDAPFPRLNDSTAFAERIVDGALLALQEWRAAQQDDPTAETTSPRAG
jgi:hypothetical protein